MEVVIPGHSSVKVNKIADLLNKITNQNVQNECFNLDGGMIRNCRRV